MDEVESVDIGIGAVESPGAVESLGAVVADGVVVLAVSGKTLVGPGGVEVGVVGGSEGVFATWANALGMAAAIIAATAPASARRCSVFRVDMGGKAPFLLRPSQGDALSGSVKQVAGRVTGQVQTSYTCEPAKTNHISSFFCEISLKV